MLTIGFVPQTAKTYVIEARIFNSFYLSWTVRAISLSDDELILHPQAALPGLRKEDIKVNLYTYASQDLRSKSIVLVDCMLLSPAGVCEWRRAYYLGADRGR